MLFSVSQFTYFIYNFLINSNKAKAEEKQERSAQLNLGLKIKSKGNNSLRKKQEMGKRRPQEKREKGTRENDCRNE